MSRIYIKKYCNQKQIILAIKNKLLFQSNKYSAGKEVGKEGRKEGREGGRKEGRKEARKQANKQARKEGRNEAESGISGHLLKVALQLYLFDLTYILYAHSRHVVHYIYIYLFIYLYLVLYIYIKTLSAIFNLQQHTAQVLSFCLGGRPRALVFVLD